MLEYAAYQISMYGAQQKTVGEQKGAETVKSVQRLGADHLVIQVREILTDRERGGKLSNFEQALGAECSCLGYYVQKSNKRSTGSRNGSPRDGISYMTRVAQEDCERRNFKCK